MTNIPEDGRIELKDLSGLLSTIQDPPFKNLIPEGIEASLRVSKNWNQDTVCNNNVSIIIEDTFWSLLCCNRKKSKIA